MPRLNIDMTAKDVDSLANELLAVGIQMKGIVDRMNEQSVESINVAHLANVDSGLLSARKLVREADAKIENELDERKTRQKRRSSSS